MQIEELFVEVPGYSNYMVSSFGTVINVKRDTELTPWIANGKLMVKLWDSGVPRNFLVHRLVAQAFFVDYDDEVEVYHISTDRYDNCIANLHLVSPVR